MIRYVLPVNPKELAVAFRKYPAVLAVLAAAVLAASAASTARADGGLLLTSLIGGGCGSTAQVFAPWQDLRSYYFTSDGGFESGGAGWTLAGGAKVVAGNEPFYLHSRSDGNAVSIPAGGSATSPPLCFGLLYPGIRMVATGTGTLRVQVIANGLLGVLSVLDGGTATVGPSWAPTPVFNTTLSNLTAPLGTKSIQLRITTTGNVTVDDIYIDPFESR